MWGTDLEVVMSKRNMSWVEEILYESLVAEKPQDTRISGQGSHSLDNSLSQHLSDLHTETET